MFTFVYDYQDVHLRPAGAETLGTSVIAPSLRSIEVDGTLPVIYSPLSLERRLGATPAGVQQGLCGRRCTEAWGECFHVCGHALINLNDEATKSRRGLQPSLLFVSSCLRGN